MSRSRGYCYTINNYTDDHVAILMNFAYEQYVTYIVIGFEIAPTTGTPHIQGYMHFEHGKTMKTICDLVPGISLIEAKAKGSKYEKRYTYCMKDGDFWEYGIRPQDGVNISSAKIIDAIKEGKTYDELLDMFPSYMIHHASKVKQYIRSLHERTFKNTRFYVMGSDIEDPLTYYLNYFDNERINKLAVVTELTQLAGYDNYEHVLFYSDTYDKIHTLWPRGVPIMYKYGYEQRVVKCQSFTIVTDMPKMYPLYNKIK